MKKRSATTPAVSRQSLEEIAELALRLVEGGNDEGGGEDPSEGSERTKAVLDFIKG